MRVLALLLLTFVFGCADPAVKPVGTAPNPAPVRALDAELADLVAATPGCSQYSFKNRGRAPLGYMQGMVKAFARSYCRVPASQIGKELGDTDHDALAWYGAKSGGLVPAWTLGLGLGMRESSGKYCTGRDSTVKNPTPEGAEAGTFQASFNSYRVSSRFAPLEAEYRADPARCDLALWKQGVGACGAASVGPGTKAYAWQEFMRSCPSFAAEYSLTLTRLLRKHFGPINRKEAEYLPACETMFRSVQAYLDAHPESCARL